MQLLRQLARDRTGNVAVTFALLLSVLLLVAGVCIDYARGVWAKIEVQAATDAAVMFVALQPPVDGAIAAAQAKKLLDANSVFDVQIKSLELPNASAAIRMTRLTVTYQMPTTIMKIFGIPYMNVDAVSQVTAASPKLDVALVLDNSGSMTTDNRIGNLKSGALSAVNILTANSKDTRIGLVPFNLFVNVGAKYRSASWINDAAPWQHLVAAKRSSNNLQSSVKRFDLFDALGVPWAGCVEARTGGYDVTDAPPVSVATRFVPAFQPDDPGPIGPPTNYTNHYVADDGDCATAASGLTEAVQQDRTCKYFGNTVNNTYRFGPKLMGPNYHCSTKALTQLTQSTATLKAAINAMQPDGGTDIAEGVAWGFRVLSQKAPFADGMSNTDIDEGGQRIMIIMTDGYNEIVAYDTINGSHYSPYGYVNDTGGRLPGATVAPVNTNIGFAPMNQKMLTTCTNAKKANIEIYTIGVSVTTPAAVAALTACATRPSNATFITDAAKLVPVFESIAVRIKTPYLSQ